MFKGQRFPNELNNFQCAIIMLSPNGWMNETLTVEWVKQIWGPPQTKKRMLVWDSYKCHISASMKKAVHAKHKYDYGCSSWGQHITGPNSQCEQECPLQGCISQIMAGQWHHGADAWWQLTCTVKSNQKHLGFNGFWKPGTQSDQK